MLLTLSMASAQRERQDCRSALLAACCRACSCSSEPGTYLQRRLTRIALLVTLLLSVLLQRSFEIWSFAFVFFFKLWLAGRKFSYGKKGMTDARVSERKSKLAAWLREGLIKLGPTFIKIGALRNVEAASLPCRVTADGSLIWFVEQD